MFINQILILYNRLLKKTILIGVIDHQPFQVTRPGEPAGVAKACVQETPPQPQLCLPLIHRPLDVQYQWL